MKTTRKNYRRLFINLSPKHVDKLHGTHEALASQDSAKRSGRLLLISISSAILSIEGSVSGRCLSADRAGVYSRDQRTGNG